MTMFETVSNVLLRMSPLLPLITLLESSIGHRLQVNDPYKYRQIRVMILTIAILNLVVGCIEIESNSHVTPIVDEPL